MYPPKLKFKILKKFCDFLFQKFAKISTKRKNFKNNFESPSPRPHLPSLDEVGPEGGHPLEGAGGRAVGRHVLTETLHSPDVTHLVGVHGAWRRHVRLR